MLSTRQSDSLDRDRSSVDLEAQDQSPSGHSPTETRRRGGMLVPPPIAAIPQGASSGDAKWEDVAPRLMPPRSPPKTTVFDVFPFSLIGKILARRGIKVSGKKNARAHARKRVTTHNIPLEITLYIVRYFLTCSQYPFMINLSEFVYFHHTDPEEPRCTFLK